MTKKEIEAQIAALKVKLKEEEDKDLLSAHIPAEHKELAEYLHSKICRWNHTDGCGWHYDRGDWTEHSRQEYLHRIQAALGAVDEATLKNVLRLLFE